MEHLPLILENQSPFSRQHWATVTIPATLGNNLREECKFVTSTGVEWRAVKGRTLGAKTTFRIYADIGGKEKVKGNLINSPISPNPDEIPAFTPHKWVTDDLEALIPSISNANFSEQFLEVPTLIDSSPAHQRWHIRKSDRNRGLIFEFWADIFHNDPVVEAKGKIVWSDRTDPNPNRLFPAGTLKLELGEFFVLDFAKKKGMSSAVKQHSSSKWKSILNDNEITLNDGAGIPLSLNILCFTKEEVDFNGDPEDITNEDVKGILNLQAGALGPISTLSLDWRGRWTSNDNIPRIGWNPYSIKEDMAKDLEDWENSLEVNTGLFGPCKFGIGKSPGQTGDQDDFGATKGTYVISLHNLKFIPVFQYAAYTELFRGVNHYEEDGSPLKLDKHPGWTTWNCKTHFPSSSDRLGKTWEAPPGTGWDGYDDQHRSQNTFAAYAMLTDDPLIDDQIAHYLTTDRACHRVKFNHWGPGAARAQGRQLQAWSQMLRLSDDPKWKEIIDIRAANVASNPPLNINNEMRVLQFAGPDGRKAVYKNGELTTYAVMWEHGLAAVGLYNLYKQHPTEDVKKSLTIVCETLLKFGYFKDNETYYTVDDVAYDNGDAPSKGMNAANVWNRIGENPKTQQIIARPYVGGTGNWTFAGILTAKEFLNISNEDLNNYIDSHTHRHEASTRFDAEWWATVKEV